MIKSIFPIHYVENYKQSNSCSPFLSFTVNDTYTIQDNCTCANKYPCLYVNENKHDAIPEEFLNCFALKQFIPDNALSNISYTMNEGGKCPPNATTILCLQPTNPIFVKCQNFKDLCNQYNLTASTTKTLTKTCLSTQTITSKYNKTLTPYTIFHNTTIPYNKTVDVTWCPSPSHISSSIRIIPTTIKPIPNSTIQVHTNATIHIPDIQNTKATYSQNTKTKTIIIASSVAGVTVATGSLFIIMKILGSAADNSINVPTIQL